MFARAPEQPVTLEQASRAIDVHLATSHMEVSLVGDFDIEEVRTVQHTVWVVKVLFTRGVLLGEGAI